MYLGPVSRQPLGEMPEWGNFCMSKDQCCKQASKGKQDVPLSVKPLLELERVSLATPA